jgi:ribosomal protein S18 acetylase RimI-like enzyme
MPRSSPDPALCVEVVPAIEVDVAQAVELANAAFSVHPLVLESRTSVERFAEEYPPGARFLVTHDQAGMVGMAMVASARMELFGFSPDTETKVVAAGYPAPGDLYFGIASVHPRGQRRGIGRALLGGAESLAADEGFRRVVLTTVRELGNVEYYEAAGYEVVASEVFPPGHYSIPVPHELCLMAKSPCT